MAGTQAYSMVAGQSRFITDSAPLSRRSILPTPNGDTSNIWVLACGIFFLGGARERRRKIKQIKKKYGMP